MSKSLTEQWKDGELPNGSYYVKDWDGTIDRFLAQNKILWRDSNNPIYASERIEVLEPVPSYEKVQKLKEQIEEANECIKDKYLWTCSACSRLGSCMSCGNGYFGRYIKKWGVE